LALSDKDEEKVCSHADSCEMYDLFQHAGTLIGGILFGVGWALTGACPSIALVQLGEGQLPAIFTLVGIVIGNFLYSVVHQRYLKWDTQNCLDD
jgi:uncharacterized membrane protein YedE/YeeE